MLGHKLTRLGIPSDLLFILMHYLKNQLANVTWKELSDAYHHIDKGVRQGGILSPLLFNVYIDEMLNHICNLEVGCTLGLHRTNILAYADDRAVIARSIDDMNVFYTNFLTLVDEHKLH